jgi:hypothetical protein
MTNASPNRLFSFLLPQLRQDSDVRADTNGAWSISPATTFQAVATSLDYKAPGRNLSVSSVPTMWARPLSIEMALHNPGHPTRSQMVEEWRGMLSAIAFAAMHGYPLSVKRLQLEQYSYHPFAKSLEKLLPDPTNALYDYREIGDQHPWRDIFIFFWRDDPVGMTSPSTIIAPSASADWGFLRWWRDGRLNEPNEFLNDEEKSQLWLWLDNLLRKLTASTDTGNHAAINTMVKLIGDFRADLLPGVPKDTLLLSKDPQYFGIILNRGVLSGLNSPIKAQPKPSSVQLIASPGKHPEKPLILLDPEISNRWGQRPEDIHVHQDKTLSAINIEELAYYKGLWQDVNCVTAQELFLPKLKFIDHMTNAIPGGLMPADSEQLLSFLGETITPLIPINPILLEYLSAEYLQENLRFRALNDGEPQVEVTLDLPLSGTKTPTNHRITHTYKLVAENALDGVPVLEIWPNIKSENWHEYYAFYFDAGLGKDTFQVDFADCEEKQPFRDNQGGAYTIAKLKEFPSSIQCLDETQQVVGLILLKQPEIVYPNTSWKVGVDFGTSFTNIYVGRSGGAEQLTLESLNLKVVDSPLDTRFTTLFEYFIPENFIPSEKPLPLSSIMTRRGSGQRSKEGKRQIIDGRIYIPNLAIQPREEWIETDLKWTNIRSNRLFLSHLILHVSALALKKGVDRIEWFLSYPSAFSRRDCRNYAKSWNDLTHQLSATTGITHICSDDPGSDHYKTESLAVAQYFADQERHDLVYSTCIDMGGGTSDISIWESNKLIHQCSIQLAGRDLLSSFLELNPAFIESCFGTSQTEWRGLTHGAFHAKIDVLLRWESERWLNDNRPTLTDNENFQGLIRLTSIGIAGLYYYVGVLLKTLHEEGSYGRDEITPVYLGGNGSRLLHWLDSTGRFARHSEINELLSRMLSCGSGFEDTEVTTRLSENPKDEVACGLVLDTTRLEGLGRKVKDPIIAGESCTVNGKTVGPGERLVIEEDVTSFKIPDINQLIKFVYDYHLALSTLDIDSIRPLKGYKRSLDPSDNRQLWTGTRRSLDKLIKEGEFEGSFQNIRVEPPFILCLKAMLNYLGSEWSGR